MRKIIDRRIYDTETAEVLTWYTNGLYSSDFGYVRENLHVTKKGAYFLHGEGGATTRYSRRAGNGHTCGGEEIIPMTKDEVFDWLVNTDQDDLALEMFPNLAREA